MPSKWMGTFTKVSEWIYFLWILQMCWVLGVLVGGFLFGFFPATYALFYVIEERFRKVDVNTWEKFWATYRTVFIRSQYEGALWVLLGIFIYYDIRLIFSYQHLLSLFIGSLFVSFLILYGMVTMMILPIQARYRLSTLDALRLAFIVSILFPHISLGLTITTVIIGYTAKGLPLLFLLLGMSTIALWYTFMTRFSFSRIEEKGSVVGKSVQE